MPPEWDELQQYLRYHPAWFAHIIPWSVYGCVEIILYRRGTRIYSNFGKNLSKRCAKALRFMQGVDNAAAIRGG